MLALITATFNSEASLKSAISSVEPVVNEIKHVFIDGGSTDRTLEMLGAYRQRHSSVCVLQQNEKGLYQALNEALQFAIKDDDVSHIGFLHSDDLLMDDVYPRYARAILASDADLSYSDICYHNASGDIVRVWRSRNFSRFKLNTGWMPPHTSVVAKKQVYEDYGLFNPRFGTAADYEWLVRVLSNKDVSVYYHPERTVSMQTGGASNASFRSRLKANAMDGAVWADKSVLRASLIRVLKPARKVGQYLTTAGAR
jgi:glycosyltransferase involved in cell wall biosynthesis